MGLTKETKEEVVKDFGRTETDTGSPEVQIALLTTRNQPAYRPPAHPQT